MMRGSAQRAKEWTWLCDRGELWAWCEAKCSRCYIAQHSSVEWCDDDGTKVYARHVLEIIVRLICQHSIEPYGD